ncbi:MAG: radical SAM protein, partial [Candidatus Aerophobetes bacterium]|nr:radical SAM protein [Candidatus Aerophobetes bacterium]
MKMPDIVLTADKTVMINYRLTCLGGFIACIPRKSLPGAFAKYAEKRLFLPAPTNKNGEAELANLFLRKVETILLEKGFKVVVCDSTYLDRFNAKVYGITTIDPFGIGPATSTMVGLSGGKEPFNKFYFEDLVKKIRRTRPNAVIIIGGPGVWQFDVFNSKQEELGIDCIVQGEVEEITKEVVKQALESKIPKKVIGPPVRQIAGIRKPTLWGMVQIGRGCDRSCRFCDPGVRDFEWRSMEDILEDVKVNVKSKYVSSITLLAEDELRYGNEPGKWTPCGKIVDLVKEVKKSGKPVSPTHANLSSAASAPEVVREYAKAAGLTEDKFSAFQVGLETGSPRLMNIYMKGKTLPYETDDWPEVAKKGFEVMVKNHIFPLATLVAGLPEETKEDVQKTIDLVKELRRYPSLIMPLFFVPLGYLRGDKAFLQRALTDVYKDLYITCFEHTSYWGRRFTSWGGESLPLIAQWVVHVGTMLAFDYFKT